jgi:hypothetical protein
MTAGILLVISMMMLATQLMGQAGTGAWPSITLGSELNIPADRVFSDWLVLNKPIQFIIGDVQLWVVLIFAAALIYWLTDWAGEMLDRILGGKRRLQTLAPQEPELADSGKSV